MHRTIVVQLVRRTKEDEMEGLMKTTNFGIGTYLAAKEAVMNTAIAAGETLDSVIAKGALEQGELAENSRQLVTTFSNTVNDIGNKMESFVTDLKSKISK